MTRIWLDPLTPKQALFCNRLCERFEAEGFEIEYTTREYAEATGKLELLGIKAQVVGKHGGANRYEKLLASAERVVELAKYINSLEVDLAFSFASPEGARVAFGLGIPYFTANDSPHSHFVAQLTIPLAIRLFTPWIMEKLWTESDIPKEKIITYHGLDPVAWLQDFTPNSEVLTELNLNADSEYVVIRPEEAQAAYMYDKGDESLLTTALRETWEEMGILSRDIKILGSTDNFLTNTNFMVTPIVGHFPYPYNYKVNSDEIEIVIEVPLSCLMAPEIFEIKPWVRNGVKWNVHYSKYNGDIIWDVTGFLLSNFLSIVFGLNRIS